MSINLLVKVDQFVAMCSCEAYPPWYLDVLSPKVAAGIPRIPLHTVPPTSTSSPRAAEVALDEYPVVADEHWHSTWAQVPTLLQKCQRQLQAVNSGTLDRCVEAVGRLLNVHASPAGECAGFDHHGQPQAS